MSDDDFSPYDLNHVAQARRKLERGEPCRHPGCLSHVSHPCEGCGRVGGTITLEEALTMEAENKRLAEENARLKAELARLRPLAEVGEAAEWIVTACREYAARHRDQTHHAECWREHPECAQRLLERWWPVIEAARKYAAAYRAYHAAPRLERFAREVELTRAGIALDAEAAAIKEGNADD